MKERGQITNLEELGWDHLFEAEFRQAGIQGAVPARVLDGKKVPAVEGILHDSRAGAGL